MGALYLFFLGLLTFLAGVPVFYLDRRLIGFLLIGYGLAVGVAVWTLCRIMLVAISGAVPDRLAEAIRGTVRELQESY